MKRVVPQVAAVWCICCSMNLSTAAAQSGARILGRIEVGEFIVLDVSGPRCEEAGSPNPFRDVRMQAEFAHEQSGERLLIPGYFAADGIASISSATAGDIWRVHFVPEKAGRWNYKISLREGENIALTDAAGVAAPGDGVTGTLDVSENPKAHGFLRHELGTHYLRWSLARGWFLKGGTDSPENLLAFADFDGTRSLRNRGPNPVSGEADSQGQLHRFQPHVQDWKPGDPSLRDGKGKGLIGALNYLASVGVNSIYAVTMNLEGDGRDVWPYTDPDQLDRFDVSKLAQWEIVFSHADRLGILIHVVLTETENESFFEIMEGDTSDFASFRKLYYRELIARFAHHRALVWNLGEENGGTHRESPGPHDRANTDVQRKAFATFIRSLDPYKHPIVVHTFPDQYDKVYEPLLGFPSLNGASLQMGDQTRTHFETLNWIKRSAQAGHPWFVCLDEIGPAEFGVAPDDVDPSQDALRQHALWGCLMAGGAGVEWYFGYKYPHNDLTCEDFRSRANVWKQTRVALQFFQEHLPFAEMRAAETQVRGAPGAYVFAKAGAIYAVYLPPGAKAAELELPHGDYSIAWFNPREGGDLRSGSITSLAGGGLRALGAPPSDPAQDWVVLIRAKDNK